MAASTSVWKSTRVRIVGAVMVVLLLAGAVAATVLGLRYAGSRSDEDARSAALDAGKRYASVMFGFTPADVDKNVAQAKAALVGNARTTYDGIMSSSDLSAEVKKQNVRSAVSIQEAGVVSSNGDRAVVLIFMNQSVTRGQTELVRVEPSRVQYSMRKSGGRWVIDDIQVITDNSLRDKLHLGPAPSTAATPNVVPPAPAPTSSAPAP
ncbi:hypothetical protein [Williamsia maris]|uniref:Mce-associated membrane protein n=1 Tax=Williamsia maris TaxID=72806 RepID=A0ABT1HFN8_9NOCA|nr:hypothetical protein [Williamsia maris]MCP2176717.1 Mce-associated membrane protein [Williamsia maris]